MLPCVYTVGYVVLCLLDCICVCLKPLSCPGCAQGKKKNQTRLFVDASGMCMGFLFEVTKDLKTFYKRFYTPIETLKKKTHQLVGMLIL